MTDWVSVHPGDDTDTVVSVSAEFAESAGLNTLSSEPAVGPDGRPLPARPSKSAKSSAASASTTGAAASKSKES